MKIGEDVVGALKCFIEENTTPVNNAEEVWVILYVMNIDVFMSLV